jgi:hypothetical protein
MRNHVYMLATAIGVDPQDIMPLSGGSLGSGQQSYILHAKSHGKALGSILKKLTRMINNDILPEALEFQFKPRDTEQSQADAETADRWSLIASRSLRDGALTVQETREFLANTADAFRDILTDGEGNIRLYDDDTIEEPETVVEDEGLTNSADAPQNKKPVVAQDAPPMGFGQKDIGSIRTGFESAFEGLLQAQVEGAVDRRRFGTVTRAQIASSIRAAYFQGLEDGGVDRAELSQADSKAIASLIAGESVYITAFGNRLYDDQSARMQDPSKNAAKWFNKSVYPAYLAGLMSADRNGMYEWVYGDTEHCDDCRRLNGQVHRMKDWQQSGWQPKSSKLDCKGYNCKCLFVKRKNARASGRF